MTRVAVGFLLLCGLVALVGAARARADDTLPETMALKDGQLLVVAQTIPPAESV